ncbi:hypothetical protein BH11ARM1_BH11ARM1_07370 [soil metagenome]
MRSIALFGVLAISAGALCQTKTFYDGYADVVYSKLTGTSTYQFIRGGIKQGQHEYFGFVRNEAYDTHGTDLPFQYSSRGVTAGLGYRYWLPGNQWFLTVMDGVGVGGDNQKANDFRVGAAGFTEWWKGDKQVTDLYAELFYVGRAEDTLLSARLRPGVVLNKYPDGRLWAYGIGQVWASAHGRNGTENRVEAGVGLGYIFGKNYTLNGELKAGYAYRGAITNKSYFNPTVYLAGNF